MNPNQPFKEAGRPLGTIAVVIACLFLFSFPGMSRADDQQEADRVVVKAAWLMENFMNDGNLEAFRDLIKKAKGVFIIPELLKGAFIIGASGGNGLLLVRDEKSGDWNGPAFYTVGGASFGLQIGGQASEVVILVMTPRGISSFLSNSLKLGADVGVAAGPVGIGASAATANLSADLISFARSKGLYGGISLDGSLVAVRDGMNQAFYGHKASSTDILIRREARSPKAQRLIEEVAKAAGR
jgi:lipid-binding SYLF domain-containing protein